MKLVDQWLKGIGLDYAIPTFRELGITTPVKLAQLSLRDMYDMVGVSDTEDRKKLFFLVERIRTTLQKQARNSTAVDDSVGDEEDEPSFVRSTAPSRLRVSPVTAEEVERLPVGDSLDIDDSLELEEDLRKLRQQKAIAQNITTSSKQLSNSSDRSRQMDVPTARHTRSFSRQNPRRDSSASHGDANDAALYWQETRRPSRVAERDENELAVLDREHKEVTRNHGKSRRSTELPRSSSPILVEAEEQNMRKSRSSIASQIGDSGLTSPRRSKSVTAIRRPPKHVRTHSSEQSAFQAPRGESAHSSQPDDEDEGAFPQPPPRQVPVPRPQPTIGQVAAPLDAQVTRDQRPSIASTSSDHRQVRMDQPPHGFVTYTKDNDCRNMPLQSSSEPENPDIPIRVVVRKRPLSKREIAKGETDVMEIRSPMVHVHEHKLKVDLTRCTETHSFVFDDAFDENATTEVVYARSLRHLVRTMFEGFKATCFAYGQTGSGKTFTMMGADPTRPASVQTNAGLYVLAARDMFELLDNPKYHRFEAYASCFEIYGGKLFDLFNGRGLVRCLEDHKQRVQILGLTEHNIVNVESLLSLMESGATNRSTGTTGANADSSRSHAILQLSLRDARKDIKTNLVGKFSFIDLAGSERGADTRHADRQTRMEGAEINTSLLALKEVIRALDKKQGHTPFRGSKLTQVLKDSFVGDKTRTLMIACVSPNRVNCEHSLNTLRYADRVKEHDASSLTNQAIVTKLSTSTPSLPQAQSHGTTTIDQRSPLLSPISASSRTGPNITTISFQSQQELHRPATTSNDLSQESIRMSSKPIRSPEGRGNGGQLSSIAIPITAITKQHESKSDISRNTSKTQGAVAKSDFEYEEKLNSNKVGDIKSAYVASQDVDFGNSSARAFIDRGLSSAAAGRVMSASSSSASNRSNSQRAAARRAERDWTEEALRTRAADDELDDEEEDATDYAWDNTEEDLAGGGGDTDRDVGLDTEDEALGDGALFFETEEDEREYRKLSANSRTLALIAAHRINLQDRIEMMKMEVDLIHSMDNSETRRVGWYCASLEEMLEEESHALEQMLLELAKYMYVRESEKS